MKVLSKHSWQNIFDVFVYQKIVLANNCLVKSYLLSALNFIVVYHMSACNGKCYWASHSVLWLSQNTLIEKFPNHQSNLHICFHFVWEPLNLLLKNQFQMRTIVYIFEACKLPTIVFNLNFISILQFFCD